jgi:hypothetical protein
MWIVAMIAAVAVATPLLYLAYYVCGPSVDNCLGILTRRHLTRFREHRLGDTTLSAVVESRAGQVTWLAHHDEYIWASDIEARAAGGVVYRWEISKAPPRPWLPPQELYLTPLNFAAAHLVRELLPLGLSNLQRIPAFGYRSGVIYDMADPQQSMNHYGPWLRKTFPQLFAPDVTFLFNTVVPSHETEHQGGPTTV